MLIFRPPKMYVNVICHYIRTTIPNISASRVHNSPLDEDYVLGCDALSGDRTDDAAFTILPSRNMCGLKRKKGRTHSARRGREGVRDLKRCLCTLELTLTIHTNLQNALLVVRW